MEAERERVIRYLMDRTVSEYNRANFETGHNFVRILSAVENMGDREYEQLGDRDAVGA